MKKYHKIETVFLRDPDTKYKTLLEGQFALPEFEYMRFLNWVWTEKVDGTNIRVMFDGESITFGGKTDRAQVPVFLVDKLNDMFLPQQAVFKERFPDGVCLYGEGYGAKIQKGGGNYRQDHGFVLFDVKVGPWWLQRQDVEEVANHLGIDVVPVIGKGGLLALADMVKEGFQSQWGDFQAEGIVAKPEVELMARNGKRIVTKLKCKDFRKCTRKGCEHNPISGGK